MGDEDDPSDQELFLFMAVSEKIEETERLRELLREARNLLDEIEEWQSDETGYRIQAVVEKIDDELAKE